MTASNRPPKRPQKKTDMLEVRVSPEEKQAFLDACRRVGRSASAVIRDAMRAYAQFGPMTRLPGRTTMIVSAFAGAALGAWALNAALHPEGEGVLDRMTAIAYAAFRGFDLNLNGEVDLAEYRISQGAVTDYLVQPGGDPDRQSESQASIEGARAGYMFGSMLSGYDIDSVALVQHPDGLSEACWRALADGYNQVLERRFERMDLNADGMLYLDEYAEFNQAHWRSLFRSNDRDEDGDLTMDDMRQVFSEAFNGSEQVFAGPGDEPDYVRACRADVGPAEPRADRAPVPEERVTMSAQGMIDMWDMDANGRVTFDEFVIANSAPSPY